MTINQNRIYNLYQNLYKKYGRPDKYWPDWCSKNKTLRQREIILIGAILTQRTSWHNAEMALRNLEKSRLLSLRKIAQVKESALIKLVRVAGFYTTKPKRIIQLSKFLVNNYGSLNSFLKENRALSREKLLSSYGIGPETADAILLYACNKPSFVIDEYTKRLVKKHRLAKRFDYDFLKHLFEKNLPKSCKIYQDFHALIIIDQRGPEKSRMAKF